MENECFCFCKSERNKRASAIMLNLKDALMFFRGTTLSKVLAVISSRRKVIKQSKLKMAEPFHCLNSTITFPDSRSYFKGVIDNIFTQTNN